MQKPTFGLQSIEQKLSSLLKPMFQGSKKEFIMINNLVKNWEEIIGKKYAVFCYPKSVVLKKDLPNLIQSTELFKTNKSIADARVYPARSNSNETKFKQSLNLNEYKSVGGKLTIGVYNSAVGFFLENNSEIILERIATFYGFKSISKIIIKQEPKVVDVNRSIEIKLPAQQESFLKGKIDDIEDKDLAETLQKLGREIFKKD